MTAPSPRRVWLWELFGLILVLAVGAGFLALLAAAIGAKKTELKAEQEKAAAGRGPERTAVAVSVLAPAQVVDRLRLPGIVQAWTAVEVPAEVAGRVQEKLVEDGAAVRQGEVLVRLDPRDFRIALERAEAALALARSTHARTAELVRQGASTAADLDRDRNALAQAETAASAARIALERCEIRTPCDGTADEVLPEAGEYLAVGARVARVLDLRKVKIEIGIPEQDVDAVRRLEGCDLIVDAIRRTGADGREEGLRLRGRKIYLSQAPRREALVYDLRLEVENPEGLLRPGMFVEAEVVREVRENSLLAPLFAVLPGAKTGEYFAFVADGAGDPVARRRSVTLGVMTGRRVEIRTGLAAGERLIVAGQRSVEDGAPVRVTETVADPADLAR